MAKCKDCNKECEAAASDNKNSWKCMLTGIPIYKTLPEGMRLATREDINPDGRRRIGLPYLVKSYLSGMYEAYPLTENTDLPNLMRFVNDNNCWIKNEKTI